MTAQQPEAERTPWPAWDLAATLAPRFISGAHHQAAAYLLASWRSRGQVPCQSDHAETSVSGQGLEPAHLTRGSHSCPTRQRGRAAGQSAGKPLRQGRRGEGRVARSVEKFSCTGGAGVVFLSSPL